MESNTFSTHDSIKELVQWLMVWEKNVDSNKRTIEDQLDNNQEDQPKRRKKVILKRK